MIVSDGPGNPWNYPPQNSHFLPPENRKIPGYGWKKDFSFWDGLVSGDELLVLGSVTCIIPIVESGGYNASRLDIFT